MRFIFIALCLALCACAGPQSGKYYFRGTYVPGNVAIEPDGSFVTTASVWNSAQIAMAQQAALYRLKQEARNKGYAFFVPEDAQIAGGSGSRFQMTGKMFHEADAPEGALPIDLLDQAAQRPIPASAVASNRAASRSGVIEATPSEPTVIEAPDFAEENSTAEGSGKSDPDLL